MLHANLPRSGRSIPRPDSAETIDDIGGRLAHYTSAKGQEASEKTGDERDTKRQYHPPNGECIGRLSIHRRDHRIAHALSSVGERIEERKHLEPLEATQRRPGEVGAS